MSRLATNKVLDTLLQEKVKQVVSDDKSTIRMYEYGPSGKKGYTNAVEISFLKCKFLLVGDITIDRVIFEAFSDSRIIGMVRTIVLGSHDSGISSRGCTLALPFLFHLKDHLSTPINIYTSTNQVLENEASFKEYVKLLASFISENKAFRITLPRLSGTGGRISFLVEDGSGEMLWQQAFKFLDALIATGTLTSLDDGVQPWKSHQFFLH